MSSVESATLDTARLKARSSSGVKLNPRFLLSADPMEAIFS